MWVNGLQAKLEVHITVNGSCCCEKGASCRLVPGQALALLAWSLTCVWVLLLLSGHSEDGIFEDRELSAL